MRLPINDNPVINLTRNSLLLLVSLVTLTLFSSTGFAQKALERKPRQPAASATAQPRQYTIEQFMDTVRVGGASFSADEKEVLFHSNKSGIFNVYTVGTTGGNARQLTNSTKESTFAVSYFPNPLYLLL